MNDSFARFKFRASKLLLACVARLPLRLGRLCGRGLGSLLVCFPNRSRRIASINIAECFPALSSAEQADLLRRRMRELGAMALELAHVWGASGQRTLARVREVKGRAELDEALAAGNGVIVLAPHIGNWEVIGLYLTECHSIVRSMYAPPKSRTMGQLILQARQETGAELVPADRSGVVKLLKTLRSGDMVGILPDQVPGDGSGLFAPFFGRPALTMTLLSNLVQKTGARVVCAFALPVASGYQVNFTRPDPDIYSTDLTASVAAMNRSVEQCARLHPEYYQWEYKRFKRQPEGVQRLY